MNKKSIFSKAFTASLPVMMGYTAMGMAAGILLAGNIPRQDIVFWAFLSSFSSISGALQFAMVDWIYNGVSLGDVAILTIDGKHDNFFKLADKKTLHKLKSGVPIAFLGFPMENLNNSNVNIDNPVASMQSGIVVAVSDFEMKDSGKTGNFLLRHNLPATGGASGSPIFNEDGEVVGLLYGINVIGQVRTGVNGNTITRAPSGAQINFGVRIDLLEGAGNAVPIKEFIKLQ